MGIIVEALVASWIEISNEIDQSQADGVEALVASWIEIYILDCNNTNLRSKPLWLRGLKCLNHHKKYTVNLSKPLWLRGLKLFASYRTFQQSRRSPCGFVD